MTVEKEFQKQNNYHNDTYHNDTYNNGDNININQSGNGAIGKVCDSTITINNINNNYYTTPVEKSTCESKPTITAEQEKYIIEKYPHFWDGVFCSSRFGWHTGNMNDMQKTFAKYINISKMIFAIKEKEKIPQLLTDKSYINFKEYNKIFSRVNIYNKERKLEQMNSIRYMLYFAKPKVSFENFEKYAPFCFAIRNTLAGKGSTADIEKNINTIIDDAMFVYEIVRPDIVYNACLTKDMVLMKDNFNRINQILLKYNKYVYYSSSNGSNGRYAFINPTKIKQFKFFIKLLKINKYIKREKNERRVVINEEVISKTALYSYCVDFMRKLHFFNSRAFYAEMCAFFNVTQTEFKTGYRKGKVPHKLQLIFDAVRKYDNEITNQQKTDK